MTDLITADLFFKVKIVYLILSKDTPEALKLLSQHYAIVEPKLKVGLPKRYSKNPACYVRKSKTIHVAHREILYSPRIILHEFYHHMRSVKDAQGGIEKYADGFAKTFLDAYKEAPKKKP